MPGHANWLEIELAAHIRPIDGQLVRVVESQEQIATTQLVDSLEEQALLEDLLEQAKPPTRPGSARLHYLLMTPFRYPALRQGSRFGRRHEPSIFYGSHSTATALAEAAYYRLVFRSGMETAPARPIRSQHTLFGATYQTYHALELQQPPFNSHHARLTDPADYTATQALGAEMRTAGVQAFEVHSARDPDLGINVGLFEPAALASPNPTYQEEWLCEVNNQAVNFLNPSTRTIHKFPKAHFLINDTLPHPST